MRIHYSACWRLVALLLVISHVATLAAITPAAATVYQRDDNYNGIWQDWGGGWKYIYYSASDYAAWALNGKSRFAYEYTSQQWWDCDKFTSWRKIGATGVMDWWIGDGGWHNLNNGWSYAYTSSDFSIWATSGHARYLYQYTQGQWWDYGTAWNPIGSANVSGAFVGDGAWHDLNNGWSYAYNASADLATWADNGLARFLYEYGKGQWWDCGTAWNKIGATSVSSGFVGDGGWHNLNNGWSYFYNSSGDFSAWMDGGLVRFSYNYGSQQWSDFGTAWYAVGATNVSSAFIGDGAWHTLGNSWSYVYNSSADLAAWADNGLARFLYEYGKGQWWDAGNYGSWNTLGNTNVSSAFVGDSAWHTVTADWAFSYDSSSDTGTWRRGTDFSNRFQYGYTTGVWSNTSPFNGGIWNPLDPTPGATYSSLFMGDGFWHSLGPDWSYCYGSVDDTAQVKYQGVLQFAYNYGIGQWSHYDRIFSTWQAISVTGMDNTFIGDGDYHGLGDGWTYHFEGYIEEFGSPVAYWDNQTGTDTLYFAYGPGQWYYFIAGMTPDLNNSLGNAGLSAVFVGDGAQHNLNNGWLFAHESGVAHFYRNETGTPLRFTFSPGSGVWIHYDGGYSDAMTGFSTSIGFGWIWDGLTHYAGPYLFGYNYAADELAFYAKVAGTPSFTNPVAFLKYSYFTHRWYDKLASSTASWLLIPTDGIGAEVLRNYWTGGSLYDVGTGKTVGICAQYDAPVENVNQIGGSGFWIYTYGDGQWYDSAWTPIGGAGASPDLYR